MGGWTTGFMMAIGLIAIPGTAVTQPLGDETPADMSRVRSRHQALRAMITTATEQSLTFRGMVDTINASDGIVYVEPGVCTHGVRACLVKVTSAGRYRSVFVKVDIERADRALMAAIGHELRHAIEVLSDPRVTDRGSMYIFYKRNRDRAGTSTAFETKAAIEAGEAVADEIRQFQRAKAPK
jgi:hypothetical protein